MEVSKIIRHCPKRGCSECQRPCWLSDNPNHFKDTPNLPQAAVNEPGQHGVQIGSLGVPDKIIVVPAPEKQGEMF